MEVILLEKVRNLGELGDKVNVAGGYGRNFLLPQGKALPATKENLVEFEKRRAELEKELAEKRAQAVARKEKLAELTVNVMARAGDEGKLFGSIGPREIAESVTALGFALEKSEVSLPNGPIREIGEHQVAVQLHSDISSNLTVTVVAEEEA